MTQEGHGYPINTAIRSTTALFDWRVTNMDEFYPLEFVYFPSEINTGKWVKPKIM